MTLRTALYPHQAQAVDKLLGLRIGALYMEMGTGKTRTALEFIHRRLTAGKIRRVLWLCPCSVKGNLLRDIDKHAENAACIRVEGIESLSGSARLAADLHAWCGEDTMLIVDESNLVKNPRALRTRRITSVAGLCRYRMILNGTPISRTEADLYAQWYLLDWRVLGYQSYWSFAANHLEYDERFRGRIRRVLNADYLTDKISPYTYTVRKADCLQLPEKITRSWEFELTRDQQRHYVWARDAYLSLLVEDEERIGSAAIYRTFTALQQVCSGRRIISHPMEPIRHESFFPAPEDNPRIQALLSTVDTLEGKCVVWCRYDHEIRDVSRALRKYGSVAEFTGRLSYRERLRSLADFEGGTRFLVANKVCAGYGLNLQHCSQMIYYNNDWDYATRAQSEDRLHRIGQGRNVIIWDICAEAGIDRRILDCLYRKESMVESFRREVRAKNAAAWLDGHELKEKDHDPHRIH